MYTHTHTHHTHATHRQSQPLSLQFILTHIRAITTLEIDTEAMAISKMTIIEYKQDLTW